MITHRCKQGSPQWHALRLGRPTASLFSKIITPAKGELSKQADPLAYELAAERILGYSRDDVSTKAMQTGRENEPLARAWYEMAHECEVEQVGICFTDDGRVGASPDGIVGAGLLEIKCPTPPVHVGYLLGNFGVEGDYKCQVQGQLWVCEREWLDTVSYCPPFVVAERCVYRDEEFIAKLSNAVREFADKVDDFERRLIAMGCEPLKRDEVQPERDSTLHMTDEEAAGFAQALWQGRAQ